MQYRNQIKTRITALLVTASMTLAFGQTIDFAAVVSLEYQGEPLAGVLEDMTSRYGIKFSYSRNVIPVDQLVYMRAERVAFTDALDMLFEGTPIIYGFIGDQLVLSTDPQWTPVVQVEEFDDTVADAGPGPGVFRPAIPSPTKLSSRQPNFDAVVGKGTRAPLDTSYLIRQRQKLMLEAEHDEHAFRMQASLFPPIQAITQAGEGQPVNLSFNLVLGVNQGLDGVEIGCVANHMRGDVNGIQIAGAYNGTEEAVSGLQISGAFNLAGQPSTGLQIAGAANMARLGGDLVQIGGGFNLAGGSVSTQIAGGFNLADEVRHSQIAPINVARNVRGAQIGVINVSDSAKVAIGILSFVRRGYKSLEVAGEESIKGNVNVRLGVRSFYNILHISSNERARTWAVGYGIGSSIRIGRSNYLQLELLSRHVNENERWTNDLNLLNQFNLNWDLKIAGKLRIAFGPTFNVAVSRLYNPETDTYGTEIPNYTWFDKTYTSGLRDPVNVKGWVGAHIGIRYSSG